jgi:oligopeptide/dipeptide ABC transporter ATP-binding protein
MNGDTMEPLFKVRGLKAYMNMKDGLVKIVDGVDFDVGKGETVGLVGETGGGKTVSALAMLGILQPIGKGKPLWKIEGEVWFEGKDLMKLQPEEMKAIRRTRMAFIPQNPIPSLHPLDVIGYQTGESVEEGEEVQRDKVWKLVVEHLGKVEIRDAKQRYYDFRHQFSGGEAQRVLIAMALVRGPSLLIADEPTSSLDVTVQRQVLQLLKAMKEQFKLSMLLITHSLGVVAEMADRVYVMYSGKIVERGDVKQIFSEPMHPYSIGLLASVPRIDAKRGSFEFEGIPGDPPNPLYPIAGCKFHPRCRYAQPFCSQTEPPLLEIEPGHWAACLRLDEIRALRKT